MILLKYYIFNFSLSIIKLFLANIVIKLELQDFVSLSELALPKVMIKNKKFDKIENKSDLLFQPQH